MTQDLSVTRLIEASPASVWRAFTEHTAEWWCPKPWETPVVEIDWRPGGRFHTVMRSPEGEEHAGTGVVLEVVPGERLVTTDAFGPGWEPQRPFMVSIWTFAPEGGGTRYTATARHWDEETLEQHRAMGFEAGWAAVAEQLEAVARRIDATPESA